MRRLLALAVVAAFLAGPTHRLMCLISCDDVAHAGHVEQVENCHTEFRQPDSRSTFPDDRGHCWNHFSRCRGHRAKSSSTTADSASDLSLLT